MRQLNIRPAYTAGLPIALAGSLAVAFSGPAAVAAEPDIRIEAREPGIRVPAVAAAPHLAKTQAAKTQAAKTQAAKTYVVRKGDTVTAIAKRYGVSVQAVLDANRLGWTSFIYPGQKLRIPGAAGTRATQPGHAKSAKTTKAARTTAPATYTVRSGDTAWRIASTHHVSVDALLAANRLSRSSIIYPGERLRIPAAASTKSKAAKPSGSAKTVVLDAEQTRNAKLIIRIGRQLGVPERGIAIALGTAMQESSLRNLAGGDRDSQGLFQQRPSTGWGTKAQVRDAERATRVFFGGPKDPNGSRTRGLLDVPGWQRMSFAKAAQSVQISAYPSLYARWEDDAYAWLGRLG